MMSRKSNKGKPTRKDITQALQFIGQKLRYLEDLAVANENILDIYINFKGDKDDFLKYLKENYPPKEEVAKDTK
tara:strand:- start:293 stop:514 length:222 start_codon:yes stop_codon:yes gene_type:complete